MSETPDSKTPAQPPASDTKLTPAEEQLAQIMARIARRAKMRVKPVHERRRKDIKRQSEPKVT